MSDLVPPLTPHLVAKSARIRLLEGIVEVYAIEKGNVTVLLVSDGNVTSD